LNMKQAIIRKKKGAEAANAILSVLSQKWKPTLVPRTIPE
jgi:hypothetical protein